MYRGSEDEALATAVIEAAGARNAAAALSAARELWLTLPQLPPGQPDHWQEKSWHALAAAGLLFEAVAAGVDLIRAGKQLRLAAFVHIVQHVGGAYVTRDDRELQRDYPRDVSSAESDLLLEILELIRNGSYADDGYSAAVLTRFFEGKGKRFVWQYMEAHEAELGRSRLGWQMLGLIKQVFETGAVAWWSRWTEFPEHEMWTAALYLMAVRQESASSSPSVMDKHGAAMLEQLPHDETARLLCCMHLEGVLRDGRNAEFVAGLERHRRLLRIEMEGAPSTVWRPMVRFINRFKDQWRLGEADVEDRTVDGRDIAVRMMVGPLLGSALGLKGAQDPVTLDTGIGQLCHDLQEYDLAAPRALALFGELLATSDRREVMALCRQFRAFKREGYMKPLRALWFELLRGKLPWRSRLYAKIYY
jgi:hypothetical protein